MNVDRSCTARFESPQSKLAKLRGDFDGDGKSDILWQHTDGSSAMWTIDNLTMSSGSIILGPGTGWSIKFRGDFQRRRQKRHRMAAHRRQHRNLADEWINSQQRRRGAWRRYGLVRETYRRFQR
jgi:hypothetical protein